MKRILLISYNYSPEITGIGKYNGEMMEWFASHGYDCGVLTAYPYYPDWKIHGSHGSKRFWFSTERRLAKGGGRLTVYRCPLYIPSRPTGVKRVILEASFFASAFVRLLGLLTTKKFDVVLAVAPSFHVGLLGLLYKIVRGGKLVYHIQDLQIEAARDLNMIKSKTLIELMFFLEKQILRNCDIASSISVGMVQKVKAKRGKTTTLFPNWTNTSKLFPKEAHLLRKEFGFNEDDKIILYSGAIGEKQGLESILLTAQANQTSRQLKFVICGNGPYKEKLEETAARLGLSNVVFLPLQPLSSFNHFLNIADLHIVIQKAGASDLVMPSKLGAILAVGGLALVTANPGTSLYTLIKEHQMGYLVGAEDQAALNHAVAELLSGDYSFMRKNARKYAVEFLSIDKVMSDFAISLNDSQSTEEARRLETLEELKDHVMQVK